MVTMLKRGGQLIGVLGLLLIAFAVAARLAGHFLVGGFQTGTLMMAGAVTVVVGSFLLLWALAERAPH